MKCEFCQTDMIIDGNMIRCLNCGNLTSGLELKYGKEPVIPIDEYEKTRWNWH